MIGETSPSRPLPLRVNADWPSPSPSSSRRAPSDGVGGTGGRRVPRNGASRPGARVREAGDLAPTISRYARAAQSLVRSGGWQWQGGPGGPGPASASGLRLGPSAVAAQDGGKETILLGMRYHGSVCALTCASDRDGGSDGGGAREEECGRGGGGGFDGDGCRVGRREVEAETEGGSCIVYFRRRRRGQWGGGGRETSRRRERGDERRADVWGAWTGTDDRGSS